MWGQWKVKKQGLSNYNSSFISFVSVAVAKYYTQILYTSSQRAQILQPYEHDLKRWTLSLLDLLVVFLSYFDQNTAITPRPPKQQQQQHNNKKQKQKQKPILWALVIYAQVWFVFERLFLSNV